jgi:hypothetical protein
MEYFEEKAISRMNIVKMTSHGKNVLMKPEILKQIYFFIGATT